MRAFWRVLMPLALVSIFMPGGTSSAAPPGATAYVEDHVKCYPLNPQDSPNIQVVLTDEFDVALGIHEQVVAFANPQAAQLFCNPVKKVHKHTVAPINHADHHLVTYLIAPANPNTWTVVAANQFGKHQVLHVGPVMTPVGPVLVLAVPTQKVFPIVSGDNNAPTDMDHFKCYPVLQGKAPNAPAVLQDEFDALLVPPTTENVVVGQPRLFCNPVDKIDLATMQSFPIQHPAVHLVCYDINPNGPGMDVKYINQFTPAGTTISSLANPSVALCVPTVKKKFSTP
jgi:hypothetical protein